jgi:hypothetical protein
MAGQQYIGTARWGTTQNFSYTGTAGVVTNPFGSGTYKVRIIVTTAAYVKVGDGTPTATANDVYMAAGAAEYVSVTPGQKVSAVQVSSGGTLQVTECA